MSITVSPIDPETHARFLAEAAWPSWLQSPEWFASKPPGKAEALGIHDGDRLVGVAVMQYRRPSPRLPFTEAYIPHGPVADWTQTDALAIYDALAEHARERGAARIRIEPVTPWHTWTNATVKSLLADDADVNLDDLAPDQVEPAGGALVDSVSRSSAWHRTRWHRFMDSQPSCNFIVPLEGRDAAQVMAGMNQMYRRNIRTSQKAGVESTVGGQELLPTFHALHVASATREGYVPMTLEFLQESFAAFGQDPDKVRVIIISLDSEPLAGAVWMRYGNHVWYTHGGSVETHREARAVNALQWAMINLSLDAGAAVYDMGGVYPFVDASSRGLLQFKVGTGGYLTQYAHERMRALRPAQARALALIYEASWQAGRARGALRAKAAARRSGK